MRGGTVDPIHQWGVISSKPSIREGGDIVIIIIITIMVIIIIITIMVIIIIIAIMVIIIIITIMVIIGGFRNPEFGIAIVVTGLFTVTIA